MMGRSEEMEEEGGGRFILRCNRRGNSGFRGWCHSGSGEGLSRDWKVEESRVRGSVPRR